ncbi:MAG: isoleucine--tRNA ligase, partial [Deltaproteobacteria bacterium]|nr:isoleucine--tRNA ligase [Deltaproteobacteria bacterium]
DVWFDSGTSFAAVLEGRPECRFPADLYLEGTDQHRGWFHSSLLASVGNRGTAPYRAVLTHGFVVDGQGRKMSKSVGNVVAPQEIIKKYGAEILRLWVASENYQEDVRISDEIMGRLVDAYRRIRNTFRFILGNISDFDPEGSALTGTHLLPLDRFALDLVQSRHRTIQKAYERFEFHRVFHTLHNLCVTDLSAFYLDIIKDRLYVSAPDSLERNSARTALWHIALTLLQDIAPILSFTAEELFSHMPETLRGPGQTVFTLRHDLREIFVTPEERNQWEILLQVRTEVSKAIEPLRQSKALGHSLDSHVRLFADEDLFKILGPLASDLATLFIVSRADLLPADQAPADAQASTELEGLKIIVQRASGDKCQRCWMYNEEIGTDAEHSDVCPRCAAVLRDLGSGA